MSGTASGFSFEVMTVNIHKGFTLFDRRFMLHELRQAVRSVGAEVVVVRRPIVLPRRPWTRLSDHAPSSPR